MSQVSKSLPAAINAPANRARSPVARASSVASAAVPLKLSRTIGFQIDDDVLHDHLSWLTFDLDELAQGPATKRFHLSRDWQRLKLLPRVYHSLAIQAFLPADLDSLFETFAPDDTDCFRFYYINEQNQRVAVNDYKHMNGIIRAHFKDNADVIYFTYRFQGTQLPHWDRLKAQACRLDLASVESLPLDSKPSAAVSSQASTVQTAPTVTSTSTAHRRAAFQSPQLAKPPAKSTASPSPSVPIVTPSTKSTTKSQPPPPISSSLSADSVSSSKRPFSRTTTNLNRFMFGTTSRVKKILFPFARRSRSLNQTSTSVERVDEPQRPHSATTIPIQRKPLVSPPSRPRSATTVNFFPVDDDDADEEVIFSNLGSPLRSGPSTVATPTSPHRRVATPTNKIRRVSTPQAAPSPRQTTSSFAAASLGSQQRVDHDHVTPRSSNSSRPNSATDNTIEASQNASSPTPLERSRTIFKAAKDAQQQPASKTRHPLSAIATSGTPHISRLSSGSLAHDSHDDLSSTRAPNPSPPPASAPPQLGGYSTDPFHFYDQHAADQHAQTPIVTPSHSRYVPPPPATTSPPIVMSGPTLAPVPAPVPTAASYVSPRATAAAATSTTSFAAPPSSSATQASSIAPPVAAGSSLHVAMPSSPSGPPGDEPPHRPTLPPRSPPSSHHSSSTSSVDGDDHGPPDHGETHVHPATGHVYRFGPDWRMYRTDHEDRTFDIDPTTGLIYRWYSDHLIYGRIYCYPIRIPMSFLDTRAYVAHFTVPFLRDHLKHFLAHFPVVTLGGSRVQFDVYCWYNCVLEHCKTYFGYIPPLHTVSPFHEYGELYRELSPAQQYNNVTLFQAHLHTALLNKNTGFKSNARVHQMIASARNGHHALSRVVESVHHPSFSDNPAEPVPPTQDARTTLRDFILDLNHYAYCQLLRRTVISDRYYYYLLCQGMHSVLAPLRSIVDTRTVTRSINHSLPRSFDPDHISGLLNNLSRLLGRRYLDVTPDSLINRRPDDVQALQQVPEDALIQALQSRSTLQCHLCGQPHPVAQCPHMARILANPVASRQVRDLLTSSTPSNRPPARPTSSLPPRGRPAPGRSPGRRQRPPMPANLRQQIVDMRDESGEGLDDLCRQLEEYLAESGEGSPDGTDQAADHDADPSDTPDATPSAANDSSDFP